MLRFRKISACRYALFLAVILLLAAPGLALADEPQINARAAALIDTKSGRVLWHYNGYTPAPPASTTKILTALLAVETASLSTVHEISSQAAAVGEQSIGLRRGERLSLGDLLCGTLMRSGNDAAFAVGEAVAGSEPMFVEWMNIKAAALGAFTTHFANTNGLPADNHVISPVDLAQLTRQALSNDFFAATVGQKSADIGSGTSARHLQNTNKLLWHDDEINGVKTGTTNAAGPCLVTSKKWGDTTLISVVFNSPDRYGDSLRLLAYGEDEFISLPLLPAEEKVAYMPVANGLQPGVLLQTEGEIWCAFSQGEAKNLSISWQLPAQISAPVAKGQHVGSIRIHNQAGEEIANIPLTAANSVAAPDLPWWKKLFSQS